MPRKHLFPLVVLLAAAAVAGMLALTRTVDLGQAASQSSTSDAAIAYRLDELDRLEASLREQLAGGPASSAQPQTVYRRAAAPSPSAASVREQDDDHDEREDVHEHEDEDEDEGRDD
jgi:hypothetical protein